MTIMDWVRSVIQRVLDSPGQVFWTLVVAYLVLRHWGAWLLEMLPYEPLPTRAKTAPQPTHSLVPRSGARTASQRRRGD